MKNFNEFGKTNNDYKNIKNERFSHEKTSEHIEENNNTKSLFHRKDNNLNNADGFRWNEHSQISNDNDDIQNDKYRYRISRINIDSSYRNTVPKNILADNAMILNNPFSLTYNSNIVTVTVPNHKLSVNDQIIIANVLGDIFFLKSFEFVTNSNYVKINHPNHGMLPFDKTKIYAPYQIKIDNIVYNDLTFIQNIPLNMLNDYHTVCFNTDDGDTYNPNYYYINLPSRANATFTYEINYKVTFFHIYGMPISHINANFPINADSATGYHNIANVIDDNTFTIVIDFIANTTISNIGGSNVTIDRIIDNIVGYPNNNNYIISLQKTFYNVSKIKLISTEFPNTEKIIKSAPSKKQNNQLFWQIMDDGDYLYNVNLIAGNYDVQGIISEIVREVENTKRSSNITAQNTSIYEYSSTLNADVSINTNTNEFTISFFGKITIENPFKISKSEISGSVRYTMEIFHPKHLLRVGTQIVIQSAIDIGVVPASVINTIQTISSIIDENNYVVQLQKFNPIATQNTLTNGGGVATQIKYPLQSRFYFDKPGTLGKSLGFRNPGAYNSITSWAYIISNKTPYQNDILVDAIGAPINKEVNNYINLNGDNYILMTNPLFKNTVNVSNVNNIFAKLLLASNPGYILYNQYIQLGEEIVDGIQSLSELEFAYYSPDGILYDFNGLEHSFTLEIYEKVINNPRMNLNSKQ